MTHWEGASLTCANDECEPYVCPSFGEEGYFEMNDLAGGKARGHLPEQEKTHCCTFIANSFWLHPNPTVCTQKTTLCTQNLPSAPALCSSPDLTRGTDTSAFGPPENQLCHDSKACWPGHCSASHSQQFSGCGPGCWLQRPTGNAATSNECPLVIKELY